jgi:hypothetical protein
MFGVLNEMARKLQILPVTGRGSLKVCEVLKISCCLQKQLPDSNLIVSLTHLPRLIPQKDFVLYLVLISVSILLSYL